MIVVDRTFFGPETWDSIGKIREVFPLFSPEEPAADEQCEKWKEFVQMRTVVLNLMKHDRLDAFEVFIKYFLKNYPTPLAYITEREFIFRFKLGVDQVRDDLNNRALCFLPAKIRDYYGSEGRVALIDDPLRLLQISAKEPVNEKEQIRKIRARFDFLLALMTVQAQIYIEQFEFDRVASYLEKKFFLEQKRFMRYAVVFPKPEKEGDRIKDFEMFQLPANSFQASDANGFNYEKIACNFGVSINNLDYIIMFYRRYRNGIVFVMWDRKDPFAGVLKQLLKKIVNKHGKPEPKLITDWFRVRFVLKDLQEEEKFLEDFLKICENIDVVRRLNLFSDKNWQTTKILGDINGVFTEVQVCCINNYLQAEFSKTPQNYERYKARQFAILLGLLYPPEVYPDIREILI